MTREFSSLAALAEHLTVVGVRQAVAAQAALEKAAIVVEERAKAEIGVYQRAVGPFPAWDLLADSTEEQKARMGYPADAPLEATGEMRDKFGHQVDGMEAVVGSPDERMLYHEVGTSKMPPRSVFGPAVLRSERKIVQILSIAVIGGIVGGGPIHGSLGYNLTIGAPEES